MPRPSAAHVRDRLATGFTLDHLWRETMGLPKGDSKERALAELTDLLRKARTPYALIGGVAVQLYSEEPRTTADIDVALASEEPARRPSKRLSDITDVQRLIETHPEVAREVPDVLDRLEALLERSTLDVRHRMR